MNPEVLEQVLSCKTLPSIPAVAARVIELTNDKNVSMKALAETITNDQGLAAKVLRTVNSSFYGMRQKCSSINQAIVMLGLSAVKTLALGFSLVSAISSVKSEGFDHIAYWRRSLYSGIAAKIIAKDAKMGFEEESFLGGLLQDVGVFALHQTFGKGYQSIIDRCAGDHRLLAKFELQELEAQHPDIGALMANRWKLPEELVMPVKYHERPTAAPTEYMKIVRAVGLGNIAADVLTNPDPIEALKKFYQRAEQWFGLSNAQSDDILKKITAAAKEVGSLLQVETGPTADINGILNSARKQLAAIALPSMESMEAESMDGEIGQDLDDLTGLPNRLKFDQTMIAAFEQARAGLDPLSLAIFEIDGLEGINASYGADAEDCVVIHVARRIKDAFRGTGALVCCYEGRQFAVALPKTDKMKAVLAAEKARARIAAEPVELIAGTNAPPKLNVTTSVGVTTAEREVLDRFNDVGGLTKITEQAVRAARRAGPSSMRVYAPTSAAA
jgi:diguanylate cyclase (GGDEF)-like protein